MKKLAVLPTQGLFAALYQGLHAFDVLELEMPMWAEAAIWAVAVTDDALASERVDQIVGDYAYEAAQVGLRGPQVEAFASVLYAFCEDLRTMLKDLGFIYGVDPAQYRLCPPSPLSLHVISVDVRMCMFVEITEMGLPPSLTPVLNDNENSSTYSRNPPSG